MGIGDRDYMRNQPDGDAHRRYEQEVWDEEYGAIAAKRKSTGRRVVVVLLAILVLSAVAAALLAGR